MSHRPYNRASNIALCALFATLVSWGSAVLPSRALSIALPTVLQTFVVQTGVASAWAAGSLESAEDQARRAQDISRTTMSPFCPGRTIDACPSEYATAWREDVRAWISEGVSTEEIKRRLKERTDHDLTGAPSTALDAVLPFIVVVLSALVLGLLLRALLKSGKAAAELTAKKASAQAAAGEGAASKLATAPDKRALDARLDEELRSLDD